MVRLRTSDDPVWNNERISFIGLAPWVAAAGGPARYLTSSMQATRIDIEHQPLDTLSVSLLHSRRLRGSMRVK
jgi:hypothetical protein